jgi:hypothetical protein
MTGWLPSGQHGALPTFRRQQAEGGDSQIKMTGLLQDSGPATTEEAPWQKSRIYFGATGI